MKQFLVITVFVFFLFISAEAQLAPPKILPGVPLAPPTALGAVAPGNCPGNALPQYCALQSSGLPPRVPGLPMNQTPFHCPLGDVRCMQGMQNFVAGGCQPSPFQSACLSRMPGGALIYGNPNTNAMQPPAAQQNQNNIMPVLNAITNMLSGGGGSTAPEPAYQGERMAVTDSSGSVTGYGGQDVSPSGLNGTAVVEGPFKQYFERCTQSLGLGTCNFKHLGTWGDKAHQARKSCHNSGEAIDVGLPFTCTNGAKFDANDKRAMDVAICMATNADEKFGVIFKDQTPARNMFPGGVRGRHNGHIHIQLKTCRH